jgi:hypothetical protein
MPMFARLSFLVALVRSNKPRAKRDITGSATQSVSVVRSTCPLLATAKILRIVRYNMAI